MPEPFLSVAPTDEEHELNTIREALRPVKEWELLDSHFDFDSSILLPSMTEELAELAVLVRANPGCPLSVFGHADPTGEIGYNKILSGRRALAVFGLITRRVELWQQLFSNPVGLDDWKKDDRAARIMQGHLTGSTPAPGVPTQAIAQLLPAYLAKLGVDSKGAPFLVPASEFLGQGADKDGKAAVQGCGESNPTLMLSTLDTLRFAQASEKDARDAANAPNRRVTILLFERGTVVPPTKWPCPRTKEGISGCRARFWSDATIRATPSESRREFPADNSTFQCRFYDRLAIAVRRRPAMRPLVLRLLNEKDKPDASVPFRILVEGLTLTGTTGADGMLRTKVPSTARNAILEVHEQQIPITIAKLPSITRIAGVQIRLHNLGFFAGAIDDKTSFALEDGIESFLTDLEDEGQAVPVTRDATNPALQALVLKEHGS